MESDSTVLVSVWSNISPAQGKPPVSEEYQQYFVHYADKRSYLEKVLNSIGLTNQDIGRSFALIAGVSDYPNLPSHTRHLEPAAEDLRKLEDYLKQVEFLTTHPTICGQPGCTLSGIF